ncbi:MAG: hypothetical protein J0H82_04460 [Alphaproteobacteria bacterium]|jgi:hypothetical protein|nr:hypothetical protein [Alphaproteobacteria bacterium]
MTAMTIARPLPGDDGEHVPDATLTTPSRGPADSRPATRGPARPANRALGTWSDQLVARLLELAGAGQSNGAIAQALGPGFTKNMVAGKLHRLGNPVPRSPRPAAEPPQQQPKPTPTSKPRAARAPRPGREGRAEADRRPLAVLIDLDARRPRPKPRPDPAATPRRRVSDFRTCQWIAGAPSWDDACKCGAPTVEGSNYCAPHEARAWQARDPDLDRMMKSGARRIGDREAGR